ncbi:MAG: hypothetical protein K8H86_02355, partial [Ignavibacteriaceae bacterium]|nr:hypothetical protein [Ignavibacteriaceae bacterium]
NMTCKTCHAPFPKLKAYGEEFAANGFDLPDQDAPRYYVETGDNELSLIRDFPLALRLEGYLSYNNSKSKQADFTAPYILKFLSGGTITKDVSYYFYFFFSEKGEVVGIEDAFIMFNNVFGSGIDATVGQFQVSDPLFKRELRLTFDDYDIYKIKPGNSGIDLTYDRGLMFTYGLPTGTDFTVEVLNGNGIDKLNNSGNFDDDKYKNVFGRISQDAGEHFRIGGFGYYGKEEKTAEVNETWIAGPDATISVEPFELNLQYVERRDKNPFFVFNPAADVKTRGAFAELLFMPEGDNSKWYLTGLFNWVEMNKFAISRRTTASAGYLLRRNIRLVGEYTYDFINRFGRVGVGVISAF